MPYLIYNAATTTHPARRAWYVPGVKFEILSDARAEVKVKTMKQLTRVSSTVADSTVTTLFTDEMWDEALTDVLTGSGGGGLTTAEHNQLFDIPNKAETASLHTAQTGDINAHTTEAVNGITLTAAP